MSPSGEPLPIVLSKARRFVLENVEAGAEHGNKVREAKFESAELPTIELPTIHPALYGSKYRYAYVIFFFFPYKNPSLIIPFSVAVTEFTE